MLLISADLDELIGLSDSIKVILRGRFVGDFDPQNVTPQELGSAMTGADGDEQGGPTDAQAHRRRRWPRPVLAIVMAMLITIVILLLSRATPCPAS